MLATPATVGHKIHTLFVCAQRIAPIWLAAEASAQGQIVTRGKDPVGHGTCQFYLWLI